MPKTGQPDTSDAQVMIALYEAQAAHNLGNVMGYIWSNDLPTDFKEFRQRFERGSNSSEEQSIQRALGYFETIGTLHRNNLINEDLVFDWIAIDMVWRRLKGFVLGLRRETDNVRMYENFEYMARRNVNWKPTRSRPAAAAKRPAAKQTRPAAKRTRPATKRARPATKKARPAAKRTAAATRTRPTTARRTRPAAKRTRTAPKRTRPAAKGTRAAVKPTRTAAKRTRPAAKPARATAKAARPAAKRARPAAKQTRSTAARGRSSARRTPAARRQG